jgi:hypothetical protein
VDKPHDTLFREVFAQPEHAAALLRSALPSALASAIDWATLAGVKSTFVDAASQRHYSDLLFSVDLGGDHALLYLLLEHKSYDDAWTVLQVLRYVVNIWHWWRDQHPGTNLLPPILPIVVHHGDQPFRSPTELLDLVRLDHLPSAVAAALRHHQPRLRLLLDDLATQSEGDLRRRALTAAGELAALAMQFARGRTSDEVIAAVARWAQLVLAVFRAPSGQQAFERVFSYLHRTTEVDLQSLRIVIAATVGPEAEETMISGYDRMVAEQQVKARVEVLLRQLQKRFGELPHSIATRVRTASMPDLDRWADRILDAKSLVEVFAAE